MKSSNNKNQKKNYENEPLGQQQQVINSEKNESLQIYTHSSTEILLSEVDELLSKVKAPDVGKTESNNSNSQADMNSKKSDKGSPKRKANTEDVHELQQSKRIKVENAKEVKSEASDELPKRRSKRKKK